MASLCIKLKFSVKLSECREYFLAVIDVKPSNKFTIQLSIKVTSQFFIITSIHVVRNIFGKNDFFCFSVAYRAELTGK